MSDFREILQRVMNSRDIEGYDNWNREVTNFSKSHTKTRHPGYTEARLAKLPGGHSPVFGVFDHHSNTGWIQQPPEKRNDPA